MSDVRPPSIDEHALMKEHSVGEHRTHTWEYRDLGDEWLDIQMRKSLESQQDSTNAQSPDFRWEDFAILSLIGAVATTIVTVLTAVIWGKLDLTVNGETVTTPIATEGWLALWAGMFLLYVALAAILCHPRFQGWAA